MKKLFSKTFVIGQDRLVRAIRITVKETGRGGVEIRGINCYHDDHRSEYISTFRLNRDAALLLRNILNEWGDRVWIDEDYKNPPFKEIKSMEDAKQVDLLNMPFQG